MEDERIKLQDLIMQLSFNNNNNTDAHACCSPVPLGLHAVAEATDMVRSSGVWHLIMQKKLKIIKNILFVRKDFIKIKCNYIRFTCTVSL
jgi:hypothetical protein